MRHDVIYKELKNQSDIPCVSLISPIDFKSFDDREKIRENLIEDVAELSDRMSYDYNNEIVKELKNKLTRIINDIDYTHLPKGIGIYVSPSFEKQAFFPFSVPKKMVVDSFFDLTEIEELLERDFKYTVLMISPDSIRLFEGEDTFMNEVFDDFFPFLFCKYDKSIIEKRQENEHFYQVDEQIEKYMPLNSLIVIGSEENLNRYRKVSKYKESIISEINGNYETISLFQVGRLIWPEIESLYTKKKMLKVKN